MRDLIELVRNAPRPYPAKPLTSSFVQRQQEQISQYGFYTMMEFDQDIAVTRHDHSVNEVTPEKAFPLHNHEFFELVYVHRGRCVNYFRDHSITLNQGDVLLLNPHAVHAPFAPSQDDFVINVLIKEKVFTSIIHNLISDNPLFSNFVVNYMYQINKTTDFLYFPHRKEHPVQELIYSLADEYCQQGLCYKNAMQASLISLFVKLTRIYSIMHQEKMKNPESNQLVVEILSYMNQNIASVSLLELSKQFGYSTSHLSKLIQKHTGKKFSEIVHHLKLETACLLLKNETLSLQQIVETVGFNDVSYFFHVFKKQYGMTPSTYRKNS